VQTTKPRGGRSGCWVRSARSLPRGARLAAHYLARGGAPPLWPASRRPGDRSTRGHVAATGAPGTAEPARGGWWTGSRRYPPPLRATTRKKRLHLLPGYYRAPGRGMHPPLAAEPLERIYADLEWSGREDLNLRHPGVGPWASMGWRAVGILGDDRLQDRAADDHRRHRRGRTPVQRRTRCGARGHVGRPRAKRKELR
jgi:hypothetical protein